MFKLISGTRVKWSIYYNETSQWATSGGAGAITFTTPKDFNDISILFYSGVGEVGEAEFSNIQVEESSSTTTYEPHKSNMLSTPSEIVLRSLPSGVQDTYNPLTGEYVRRIGELVLEGGSHKFTYQTLENTYRISLTSAHFIEKAKSGAESLSNTMTFTRDNSDDKEHYRFDYSAPYGSLVMWIDRSKISSLSHSGINEYFSQNPTTVQYELSEPIIKKVEPKGHPFAYENGHVILESGYQGQSLLPELVYSVPASKSGVLSTASITILSHEQRLHKLEDLLLRESVLMDYRFALSLLDEM